MGIIISVAFAVMVIGYLLGKGDVAAKRSPDLLAPEPIKKFSEQIKDTNTRPLSAELRGLHDSDDEPTSHLCQFCWANHRTFHFSSHYSCHHSMLHDKLLDPTNLLSPLNPANIHSVFDDDIFTGSMSGDDIFNSSIHNDSFSSFDSHNPFD
ncbi:hypothetical protein SAMN04488070_0341 [Pseudidiomarina maritima]|uniref:Uncharacterized protein n=1 Tax=Pseudidiomarina maritima TaxID=519453 RepID=A0A1I6G9K2_9GAMM|nr:hypothetical protein [Pseudidiomarina maritima]SFR38858.1 hypothetical protein SAMN04488070_0341 [Pseudidiomarina maritima]